MSDFSRTRRLARQAECGPFCLRKALHDILIDGAQLTESIPTLEIFEYSEPAPGPKPAVNRPGLAHLAFSVPSVAEAQELVLAHGGTAVGEIVTLATANGAEVTWCYVRDPEGNIVELQSWAHAGAPRKSISYDLRIMLCIGLRSQF